MFQMIFLECGSRRAWRLELLIMRQEGQPKGMALSLIVGFGIFLSAKQAVLQKNLSHKIQIRTLSNIEPAGNRIGVRKCVVFVYGSIRKAAAVQGDFKIFNSKCVRLGSRKLTDTVWKQD